MHPDAQLLKNLYGAFATADLATIQASIADAATAEVAGGYSLSGTYKGKDEVLGLLGEFISRSEGTFKAEVHDVLASDDHVVVLSRVTAQAGDKSLDERGVEVFHVEDGKITTAYFTGMDTDKMAEFFG